MQYMGAVTRFLFTMYISGPVMQAEPAANGQNTEPSWLMDVTVVQMPMGEHAVPNTAVISNHRPPITLRAAHIVTAPKHRLGYAQSVVQKQVAVPAAA